MALQITTSTLIKSQPGDAIQITKQITAMTATAMFAMSALLISILIYKSEDSNNQQINTWTHTIKQSSKPKQVAAIIFVIAATCITFKQDTGSAYLKSLKRALTWSLMMRGSTGFFLYLRGWEPNHTTLPV